MCVCVCVRVFVYVCVCAKHLKVMVIMIPFLSFARKNETKARIFFPFVGAVS